MAQCLPGAALGQCLRNSAVSRAHTSVATASYVTMEVLSERWCGCGKLSLSAAGNLTSGFWDRDGGEEWKAWGRPRRGAGTRSSGFPVVEARLFGPTIFEASKLRVLFLGLDRQQHPERTPRTYTLTHSDITAKLTLAISRETNKAQFMGWYSKLQRDEVVAEWKKVKGHMAFHVHCHISGSYFLHTIIAKLRYYIFRKELPVVLAAFLHGDRDLFDKYPDLKNALVWVYFHSTLREYNQLECWGPLFEAVKRVKKSAVETIHQAFEDIATEKTWPQRLWPRPMCSYPCDCCSRHGSLIPLPDSFSSLRRVATATIGHSGELEGPLE
eukprot:TRINITY_DN1538_c0_g1_i1.p1 TRINITY_DN1538_c0_g1~~TRINITY_DN1538_c0_g1_i1.p1  ORF type:complete len:327 (+),score=20.02 TRINITY_DN1538_c0_g1_i1:139-1119(+)